LALKRTRQWQCTKSLIWALLSFAALQTAFAIAVDRWWPTLRHPEFGRKLAMLEAQASEHRGAPLLLALGTSRTAFGFCASGDGLSEAWQFNFGLTGIGPVQELVCLDQVLRIGIRPSRLLIEVHPAFLHQTADWCETKAVDVRKLDRHGLEIMCRYAFEPYELALRWARSRLAPCYSLRVAILARVAPDWLDEVATRDERMLVETDVYGWSRFPVRPADEADRRRLGRWCADLYTGPLTDFQVTDGPRRAIAEMLAICRRERIDAAVVLMPEGKMFRKRYPDKALARLDAYLAELHQDSLVRVFDCRRWCDDVQFCDGQHLLPEGALAFTNRLHTDLLAPWLAEVARPATELARRPGSPARQ
jgi:hypothetical protein